MTAQGLDLRFLPDAIFRRCVEDSSDAIMLTGTDGKLRFVNRSWMALYGYGVEEVLGQRVSLLHSGCHGQGFYQSMWQDILSHEKGFWSGEIVNRAKDGQLKTVLLTITPYRGEGGFGPVEGFMGLAVDQTAAMALKHQLQRHDKLVLLGTLAGALAHEIGTPLGVIRGRAEMVCRALVTPLELLLPEEKQRARGYAQVITDQVDRVTRVMERILGFARSDPVAELAAVPGSDSFVADQQFAKRDVSKPLRVLMDDVQGLVAEHFRKARIKIEIVLPKESLIVENAGAVEQVLVNLLLNAAQALDPSINDRSAETGQSWTELESRRVLLRLLHTSAPSFQSVGPHGLAWIFVVEDSGPGVPIEIRERIFDPLFTKGSHRGTGLGLAIASKIANDLGGRLVLAERPCAGAILTGARFEFWLGTHVMQDESIRVQSQSPIP